MKRILLVLFFLLAACATGPTPIEDARQRFDQGRTDEALAILQKASRENPQDNYLRVEYHHMRETAVAQWLAQADTLRQTARFDAAETLYRRVLSHDPANARATAGLTQIETDRRHAAAAAQAEQLVRAGKFREAQDVLRPVLTENPQQKDARRLQRQIDEKLVPPVIVSAQLKPASAKPISIELRDVTLRNIFETLQRATGINFIFDRDVRSDQR
ncbi:MAG TPA: tetratricopeptide repeat protein, partial [Burkholderiales bacterium]